MPKTLEVDRALSTSYDERLQDLELAILKTARPHAPQTLDLLQPVPGIGPILRRVVLDAIHHSDRFPSVQDFAASGRLGKCRQESGGQRLGTAGQQMGTAHRTWAFSEAATLVVRHTPQAQKLLARLQNKPDPGKALSLLAHQLGRAVEDMLKRPVAFARDSFLQTCGRSAGEPGAELDAEGDEPA